jgi:hypothetical protein
MRPRTAAWLLVALRLSAACGTQDPPAPARDGAAEPTAAPTPASRAARAITSST